jgi:hypothetical protein
MDLPPPIPNKKYYGVNKHKEGWGVTISIDGKSIWLGSFPADKLLEAAKTYDVYRIYYNHKLKEKNIDSRQFFTNGLLSVEEISNIETNGIPGDYQRENIVEVKPISELPKGITRKGTKFRVCIQNRGKKYEKLFDSLDIAISTMNRVRADWSK